MVCWLKRQAKLEFCCAFWYALFKKQNSRIQQHTFGGRNQGLWVWGRTRHQVVLLLVLLLTLRVRFRACRKMGVM